MIKRAYFFKGIIKRFVILLVFFYSGFVASQEITHLETLLHQLDLDLSVCKTDLVVAKVQPNNPEETIVVIPEIVQEEEGYFELNSHILIIETNTGKIKSRYFEGSLTNEWYSDAVRLAEIKIDTAPYDISDTRNAFGIRVYYYNNSHPNPYSHETISLFFDENNTLKQVLKNFEMMSYGGEVDSECEADLSGVEKVLILKETKTNGYFDILVKSTVRTTTRKEAANGDCVEEEKITNQDQVLTFENGKYQ
ncbi:hypothetical protein Celal_2223 [Cellulophaga algicola DSM 14237]|uniref:Uncharacterized protein n=1 Tax=Cellulophaga algicola (strain DSM 14237 / IC166 / ACAM 630) TaxID=688270 RepID=E6X5X5_CELAD|nr:hypothetical protein [Cellulophaga algicola]ADV49517.1 hypothetical protein Celal_2223 [Cellulophaga algicola DSM 14237]